MTASRVPASRRRFLRFAELDRAMHRAWLGGWRTSRSNLSVNPLLLRDLGKAKPNGEEWDFELGL